MAKKRGLAANRGLDALLGSIKKEKQITARVLESEDFNQSSLHASDVDLLSEDTTTVSNTASKQNNAQNKNNSVKQKNKRSNNKNVASDESALSDASQASHLTNGDDDICLVQIALNKLQSGKYQPRRDMSEAALAELASSIKQHGVMQPIVIRPLLANENKLKAGVTHEIIAGERRWRAAKLAGIDTIPAIERVLSDELAIALALIENIQREDLTVIEQAAALQRFHTEFGMSHAMIAEVVGKARTTVSNLLRLNQLHDTVKQHLTHKHLDMGHARTLLSLSDQQQPIIAKKIIDGGLTVREAEQLVKSILHPVAQAKDKSIDNKNKQEVERLNQRLSDMLGAPVKLKQKKDGKGSMEIFFQDADELQAILTNLNVQ